MVNCFHKKGRMGYNKGQKVIMIFSLVSNSSNHPLKNNNSDVFLIHLIHEKQKVRRKIAVNNLSWEKPKSI